MRIWFKSSKWQDMTYNKEPLQKYGSIIYGSGGFAL